MASIRFGAGIVDARGSISGQTFSRNHNGAYIRARVAPVQPDTPAQTAARAAFGSRSSSYSALTDVQAAAWVESAKGSLGAYTNRLGEAAQYTGAQLYNSLNGVLDLLGVARIAEPPVVAEIPSLLTSDLTLLYNTTSGEYDVDGSIAIAGTGSWGALIEVGTSLSSGVLATSSVTYRLMDASIDLTGADIGARLLVAVDDYIPTPERESVQAVFVKIRIVDQVSGQAGPAQTFRLVPSVTT
jgi:hypothetical protein